jgi:signal peptide peptidase SppA
MEAELHYPNVVGAFFDSKWAMAPDALQRCVQVVNRWAIGVKMEKSDVAAMMEAKAKPIRSVSGKVAVIPVFGVIHQRLSMMDELSYGGSSTEMLGRHFDAAMADSSVQAIVLNIDSPGGGVYGVQELADKIYNARGHGKQIIAVANSLAASAAYWIGSAAEQFVVTPSGEVGSIGVYAMHVDQSKLNESMGVAVNYISAGKFKIEGNPDSPLEAEARSAIQESVNVYYDGFTSAVARHRGVKQSEVKGGFGEGRVVTSDKALSLGMVDRVASFEDVVGKLTAPKETKKAEDIRLPVMSMIHKRKGA